LRDDSSGLSDWFYTEFPPRARDDALAPATGGRTGQEVRDQLF